MAEVTATCPFCPVSSSSELAIQYHIFESHGEDSMQTYGDESRQNATSSPSQGEHNKDGSTAPNEWFKCTRVDCGDYIHLGEIDQHLEFHQTIDKEDGESCESGQRAVPIKSAQEMGGQSSTLKHPASIHDERNLNEKSRTTQMNLMDYFSGRAAPRTLRKKAPPNFHAEPGRLGKRDLGPHAFEKEMPAQARRHLLNDAQPHRITRIGQNGSLIREIRIDNETSNVVTALADLCALDSTTAATYFCNRNVKHVCKIRCDGNFCGFWNIQMLISYLQLTDALPDMEQLPNVMQIQDSIEEAWKNGICVYGKTETGGIRGTRKWIGTQEVVAYFTQIGVPVDATGFRVEEKGKRSNASASMLDHIEAYFLSGSENAESHGSSHITRLPPVYFQRFGHSMTIVGLERKRDGTRNLLVFDPSLSTAPPMQRLIDGSSTRANPGILLKPYRRSDASLSRWDEFEIAMLNQR